MVEGGGWYSGAYSLLLRLLLEAEAAAKGHKYQGIYDLALLKTDQAGIKSLLKESEVFLHFLFLQSIFLWFSMFHNFDLTPTKT